MLNIVGRFRFYDTTFGLEGSGISVQDFRISGDGEVSD